MYGDQAFFRRVLLVPFTCITRTTMKTIYLLLVSLPVILFSCSTEDEVISPLWGIDFSAENSSALVTGSVEQFIGQTKTTYIIKTANLRSSGGGVVHALLYTFESGATMEIKIAKRTVDTSYFYPGTAEANQLLSATFNGIALSLGESKVMVQPRTEENKLATIIRLQTSDKGFFDGTVGRVPLLK